VKAANAAANAAPSATRVPGWAYPTLTLASLLLGGIGLVRGTSALTSIQDSDLTNFFFKSALSILNGDPWHMYAVRSTLPDPTYPNYNPPLSMFLMAPLIALARALGIQPNGPNDTGPNGALITFVALPFILLVPLLGYFAVWALRRLYPQMPETQQLLAFALIVIGPLAWQSISPWYHVEQPLMLCLLILAILALQRRNVVLAGVLSGLAVLTRTTALMPLIALGVLLLADRDWRTLRLFGGTGAAVAAVGFAPFFLVDPRDAIYSFVSWRGTAIIGSNSVWTIFAYNQNDGSLRHLLDSVARRLDFYAVVIFILIAAWLAARRFGITAFSREAWAVVALAALAVPLLSKTTWPYYYLEPFIFILIWEFASMHDRRAGLWRWPVLSLGFLAVAATLSQFTGLRSVGAADRVAVGLLEFGAMLAFVLAIWSRLNAAKPETSGANASGPWFRRSSAPALAPAPAAGPSTPLNPMNPMNPMGARGPASQIPQAAPRSPLWPADGNPNAGHTQPGPGPYGEYGSPGWQGPENRPSRPWGGT
jgi:hypothetical protein